MDNFPKPGIVTKLFGQLVSQPRAASSARLPAALGARGNPLSGASEKTLVFSAALIKRNALNKPSRTISSIQARLARRFSICNMLGVFAEFETNLRRECQAEGIIAADLRRSTRKRSGANLPKAGRRPGSPASWESRAESCTMQKAMLKRMKNRVHEPISVKSCRKQRRKSCDLFSACSSRCPYM